MHFYIVIGAFILRKLNPFGISNDNWLRNGNTKIRSFLDVAISATLGYFRYVKFA